MAKIWVLDTETKGTGAEMVPLEKLLERKRSRPAPVVTRRSPGKPAERPPKPERPREPRRFRVVDVMTGAVVAEDADTRATVDALRGFGSVVDARVSVWDREARRYRLLTLGEQKNLWRLRDPG